MVSAETRIDELQLAAKERHALEVLGIATVAEIVKLNLQKVLSLRGYGERTYCRLRQTQQQLRRNLGLEDVDEPAELGSHIADLPLGFRAYNALRRLRVETVRDFLILDLTKPPLIRGCGVLTYRQLVERQTELRRCFPTVNPRTDDRSDAEIAESVHKNRLAAARDGPAAKGWRHLPFFSGEALSEIAPNDLHRSYCPHVGIGCLMLPRKATRILGEGGIATVGQLLLTPRKQFVGRLGLGAIMLRSVQRRIDEFFEARLRGAPWSTADTSSPGAYLRSLLAPVVRDERQLSVFLRRIGSDGPPPTLQELAHEYGVTRERVRQIQNKAVRELTTYRAALALSPFHEFMTRVLQKKPRVTIQTVCQKLRAENHWDDALPSDALIALLPFFPDIRCVDDKYVSLLENQATDRAS